MSAMSSIQGKSVEDICNWLRENMVVPESVLDDFKGISKVHVYIPMIELARAPAHGSMS